MQNCPEQQIALYEIDFFFDVDTKWMQELKEMTGGVIFRGKQDKLNPIAGIFVNDSFIGILWEFIGILWFISLGMGMDFWSQDQMTMEKSKWTDTMSRFF